MSGGFGGEIVVVRESRAKMVLALAGCLMFVALGLFMVGKVELLMKPLLGVCAAVFGVFAVIGLLRIVRPGQLLLTREGLEMQRLGKVVRRRWDEIAAIGVVAVERTSYVHIGSFETPKALTIGGMVLPPRQVAGLIAGAYETWTGQPAPLFEARPEYERDDLLPGRRQLLPEPTWEAWRPYVGFTLMVLAIVLGVPVLQAVQSAPGMGDAPVRWIHPPTTAHLAQAILTCLVGGVGLAILGWSYLFGSGARAGFKIVPGILSVIFGGVVTFINGEILYKWFFRPSYGDLQKAKAGFDLFEHILRVAAPVIMTGLVVWLLWTLVRYGRRNYE